MNPNLHPGALLQGGRYRIIRLLGQGGMGAVYLAEDLELFGRACVVKEMLPHYATQTEKRKAEDDFRREAQLLAQLNEPGHARIPEIYGYFVEGQGHYLVMKYVQGENLEERLERLGHPLPAEEVTCYALQVCDALAYMHRQRPQPVVHRDIKPANIIVDQGEQVWLVDFGLARASLQPGAWVVIGHGKTVGAGTPGYTPLEQWSMRSEPKSDVYALGATMHHLLAGLDPRDRFDPFPELDLQILRALSSFPRLRSLRPSLSTELEEIVAAALAQEPAQRPSAAQMKDRLEALSAASEDRVQRLVSRWIPTLGKIVGLALVTAVEILLQRKAEGKANQHAGPAVRKGTGQGTCLYCGGQGVTIWGDNCPICGGTGRR